MMRQHSKSTPKQIKQLHRMVNKTLKDFSLFPHEARILVACSGGPDSMVLLHVLQYVKVHRKARWTIGVTTMDHSIRRESLSELQMVASYCNKNNLPFWGVKKDIPTIAGERKESLETVGRCERYKWFNELAAREHYDYIVTRVQYIEYCVDASNEDVKYNRNRIRHEVIPTLQTINPNVVDALCRLGDIAQVDEAYLNGESQRLFIQLVQSVDNGFQVSRRRMRALPLAMQRRLWQLMIPSVSLSLAHQEQLAHIIRTGEAKTFTIQKVTINAQCDTILVYCKH